MKFFNRMFFSVRRNSYIWMLFFIFLTVNCFSLGTFPHLVGDEGYEGLSVIDHISDNKPIVIGRESYVAFWGDYVRVPFVNWLGPTALAMRLPFLITSLATFFLMFVVLRRLFGEKLSLFALTFFEFSPALILYQRISWPINFLPFFFSLLLFVLTSNFKYKPLITGFIAGLATSTHVIFAGTFAAIIGSCALVKIKNWRNFLSWWTSIVGFIAGFGMQIAILLSLSVEDARVGTIASIPPRLRFLIPTLVNYLSGASYIGEYIGQISSKPTKIIFLILLFLVAIAVFCKQKRDMSVLWIVGIIIGIFATAIMVNYFRTRYFHLITLSFWTIAGVGFGKIVEKINIKKQGLVAILCSILLSTGVYFCVYLPYSRTGGTTKTFMDSADSWDTAGHFADINPLVQCIRGKTVYAREPKIQNRLLFLRYVDAKIKVAEQRERAPLSVEYREFKSEEEIKIKRKDEVCPAVRNFIVIPNEDYKKSTSKSK